MMIRSCTTVLHRFLGRNMVSRGRYIATNAQGVHRLIWQPGMLGGSCVVERHFHAKSMDKTLRKQHHGNRYFCSSKGDVTSEAMEATREAINKMREVGYLVPDSIREDQVEYAASLTKTKRERYLSKLWKRELEKTEAKKQKMKARMADEGAEENEPLGAAHNRFLRRMGKGQYTIMEQWNLATGMKFGANIAFDFTYESLMVWREIKHLMMQFGHLYAMNKTAQDPLHIHWVNFAGGGFVEREARALYKAQYDHLMIDITSKGLLDVFPREKIVYLTPDSDNLLKTYDHDKVYVIGALVDTSGETGASLGQAKKLGVEHCRLPLSECLQWSTSSKSLTLDAVAKILMDLSQHGDIREALENNVPQRKHDGLHPNIKGGRSRQPRSPQKVTDKHAPWREHDVLKTYGLDRQFSHSRAKRSPPTSSVKTIIEEEQSVHELQPRSRARTDQQNSVIEEEQSVHESQPRSIERTDRQSNYARQTSNSRARRDQPDSWQTSQQSKPRKDNQTDKAARHRSWLKSGGAGHGKNSKTSNNSWQDSRDATKLQNKK